MSRASLHEQAQTDWVPLLAQPPLVLHCYVLQGVCKGLVR